MDETLARENRLARYHRQDREDNWIRRTMKMEYSMDSDGNHHVVCKNCGERMIIDKFQNMTSVNTSRALHRQKHLYRQIPTVFPWDAKEAS